MANAADYIEDVQRYDSGASEDTVGKIVRHLGIALQNKDSSLVSASDPTELGRVRDRWMMKKLGLDEAEAGLIVDKVATTMKADRNKQRVTFYYLAAKEAGKLGDL
jgi:Protein of unknown function (DUF2853)